MSGIDGFSDKVGFIWSVADLLRGDIRQHEYGQFILPFVVLRRLDCVLDPTKDKVIERAKSLEGKIGNVDPILERVSGAPFYNTSPLTFTALLNDDKNIRANLTSYIAGFSSGAADVLEKYRFAERIDTLDKAGLLYQVVAKFADIDLHPEVVPNHAMGYIFEELLRRFSEMQNESAGEHFTPREVIRLMVNILFAEDEQALSGPAPVRTMYDPACGTGGMLSAAQDYLAELNPEAHLEVYGQELNPETWAICRSDMLIKGENPENIGLGNSLSADNHAERHFDYMLANPPFGVKWEKYAEPLVAEAENEGWDGRFGAGLPPKSDGSLLFLQHMISKMRAAHLDNSGPVESESGSRIAIVLSGSPLSGGAISAGTAKIRKWIIENDWLEAIVALPDQLFYNTPLSTYVWVVTNRKRSERRGRVLLLDARNEFSRMRKGLGEKRKYISDPEIAEVTRLYGASVEPEFRDRRVKVLSNDELGFQRIVVEQPLRRKWTVTPESLRTAAASPMWSRLDETVAQAALTELQVLTGRTFEDEAACLKAVKAAVSGLPVPAVKVVAKMAAAFDPSVQPILDKKGLPLPDAALRDTEDIPLKEDPEVYLKREIHPFAADAWIDQTKTDTGYEIRFGRHFFSPRPARGLSEIDGDMKEAEQRLLRLSRTEWSSLGSRLDQCPVVRAKWLFSERNVRGADAPLGSVISDRGVVHRDDLESAVMNPGEDLSQYKLVEPGDFVIGLRSFQHGIVGSEVRALVSPAYTVLVPNDASSIPLYRHYLRSPDIIDRLRVISSGIRQGRTITYSDFGDLPIPVPPEPLRSEVIEELSALDEWVTLIQATHSHLASLVRERANVVMRHPKAGVLGW